MLYSLKMVPAEKMMCHYGIKCANDEKWLEIVNEKT
jgi:hypothetical protein